MLQLVIHRVVQAESRRMTVAPSTCASTSSTASEARRLQPAGGREGVRGAPRRPGARGGAELRLSANGPGVRGSETGRVSRDPRGPPCRSAPARRRAARRSSCRSGGPAPAHPPASDAAAAAATARRVAADRGPHDLHRGPHRPPRARSTGLHLACRRRRRAGCAPAGRLGPGSRRHGGPRRARGVLRHDVRRQPRRRPRDACGGPRGPAEQGLRIGEKAAAGMIESRDDDGRNDLTRIYSQPDEVGYWQPPEVEHPTGGHGRGLLGSSTRWCDPSRRLDGPTAHQPATPPIRRCWRRARHPDPGAGRRGLTAQFFAFNPLVMYRTRRVRDADGLPRSSCGTPRGSSPPSTPRWRRRLGTVRLKFESASGDRSRRSTTSGTTERATSRSRAGHRWSRTPSTPTTPAVTHRRPRRSPR